jgi:hypothetical protein
MHTYKYPYMHACKCTNLCVHACRVWLHSLKSYLLASSSGRASVAALTPPPPHTGEEDSQFCSIKLKDAHGLKSHNVNCPRPHQPQELTHNHYSIWRGLFFIWELPGAASEASWPLTYHFYSLYGCCLHDSLFTYCLILIQVRSGPEQLSL